MAFVRTALLLGFLTGIFLGIGYLVGGTPGLTLALILSLILNFSAYWFSDRIVLSVYGAKPLKDPELRAAVSKLARKAGIPTPKLFVIENPVPNAFATGRSPKHGVIAVTTGLLENLNADEVEGVLSHEISHIKNRDILVSTVAAVMAGAIAYLAQMVWFGLYRDNRSVLALLPVLILAPLAATMIRFAISRTREFLADRTGALISGKPEALASALKKISGFVKAYPSEGNPATSHMWIVNPLSSDFFSRLFSTHPPVEERVRRLELMARETSKGP